MTNFYVDERADVSGDAFTLGADVVYFGDGPNDSLTFLGVDMGHWIMSPDQLCGTDHDGEVWQDNIRQAGEDYLAEGSLTCETAPPKHWVEAFNAYLAEQRAANERRRAEIEANRAMLWLRNRRRAMAAGFFCPACKQPRKPDCCTVSRSRVPPFGEPANHAEEIRLAIWSMSE